MSWRVSAESSMKRTAVVMAMLLAVFSLPGCGTLGTAFRSKETQGMLLGGLLGAGALTLGMFAFGRDEGAGGLGKWAAGGGAIGALAGWYLVYQFSPDHDIRTQRRPRTQNR